MQEHGAAGPLPALTEGLGLQLSSESAGAAGGKTATAFGA